MYAPERQELILDLARQEGRVEVGALAERLSVTPETVRRDLTALERFGVLRRVHGGALPVERPQAEPSVAAKQAHFAEQKRRIAARALQEVPHEGTVLLDSGTTVGQLAELLPPDLTLTVITNSPTTASAVRTHPGIEVYVLGGRVRGLTGAAVGPWLESALDGVCVDVAFMGTNGFSVERQMTTPDQSEAQAKAAMIRAARRVVVLADSSKAGQEHFHRFAQLDQVALLITDDGLDEETAQQFDDAGTDVIRT